MVEIKEVKTKKDIKEFIEFPLRLYKTCPQFVPPLYGDEKKVAVLGGGVPDPFGQDLEVYKKCRKYITDSIDLLVSNGFFSEMTVMAIEREHIKAIAELEKMEETAIVKRDSKALESKDEI